MRQLYLVTLSAPPALGDDDGHEASLRPAGEDHFFVMGKPERWICVRRTATRNCLRRIHHQFAVEFLTPFFLPEAL